MSTHKESIKSVLVNFRITQGLYDDLKKQDINVSDTCRLALIKELTLKRMEKQIDKRFDLQKKLK